MFCHITKNWRGKTLGSFETIVDSIGNTRTGAGLRVKAKLDKRIYPTGVKIPAAQMKSSLATSPRLPRGVELRDTSSIVHQSAPCLALEVEHIISIKTLRDRVAVFSLLALWLGNWTADRILAPVTNLAAQLRASVDAVESASLDRQWGDDEVEELAVAFESYMSRVRELMARERELTANVSHELRTPIMVASSSVELILAGTALDDTTREQLTRLQRAIRKMASLTDAFLILGREAVIQEIKGADSPVEPTLREVIEARREAAERKSLHLDLEVEGSPKVQAPKTAISVVLDNLLGNAVKYTDDGKVTVRLDSDGVTISDTGPGIPRDEREKVFEREYRGRGVTPGGAGLGLAIVRALCDHYGWRISLEGGAQGGTTANLRFSV